jgi:SNF2 family DNA or RNA helicase
MITLMEEQKRGVEKSTSDYFSLFMRPGTGKTYTALAILDKHFNYNTKVLVLCPKSVINEWNISIEEYESTHNFEILNYERFSRLKEIDQYDVLIIDEAHKVKNPKSKAHKNILKMSVKYKLLLTGTPHDGKAEELLALSQIMSPNILGNYWSCLKRDFILDDYNDVVGTKAGVHEKYIEKMSPYMYVLDKLDSVVMPELTIKESKISMLDTQKIIYKEMEAGNFKAKDGTLRTCHSIAIRNNKLRTICSGFYRDHLDNLRKISHNKLHHVNMYVRDNERVVIFINWTYERKDLVKWCEANNITYKVLDGSTNNTPTYIQEIKEFNYNVLIVNYKSGGAGLNLVKANFSILYSLPHSYIDFDQSIKRTWRKGQENDCNIVVFLTKFSIENKIMSTINKKSDIVNKLFK